MRSLRWVIAVSTVAAVALVSCGANDDPNDTDVATARLEITALAGPVCPVETDPPSPECAQRPVVAATIVVTAAADGTEVARGTTGSDGMVGFDVIPGGLAIIPQPVEGLLGTAPMINVAVTAGQTLQITVDYDTGIR